ncbi:Virus X resistance protein-like, coiled-coil domain [Sesbania bispinosa]|nr:Virus X resistance protein-like, coiled-coil domain [Sesbania bispinosa]
MAEALVGGAFLSGFINVVFDRLLSPHVANLIRGKKLEKELVERLKTALCAAEALLIDAEQKQIGNPRVKNWLDNLRDAVYVADDLLDHFFTKAATQKEVTNFLPHFLNFQDREMVNKMKEIVRRIEDIEKHKYILGLKENPRENLSWRIPSTSLVKGSIYGRESDQDAIAKILNDNSEDKMSVSVIPIVGLGGVGKTTLAQWLYSNEDLMKEFDLKAWICVSAEFDIVKITKTIIEAVTSSVCNTTDLNLLQLDLKKMLVGKKFFVVLDDVWSDDYSGWNSLMSPFQYGTKGNHANFPKSYGNSTLEKIGRMIVEKCKGLPLAAETLGSLLRTKHDIKDWNTVLMSNIWEFSVKDSKIIPALLISYYHLPPHLKRCFAYLSLYPKDYQFVKEQLILFWMAEDLLRPPKMGETLEEVGCECFDDLTSRLFLKQNIEDKSFVMHDLMHDLAIYVGGDFYFRSEELGKEEKIQTCTRHLSCGKLSYSFSKDFDAIDELKSLRTFLPIKFSYPSFSLKTAALIMLSKFKLLRVLSFYYFWELDVLPNSIGELIHLRYLDLSNTSINTLPESLSNLYNLQTLKLFGCHKLTMLPSGMQNLVNLRHLDIRGTCFKEMPQGLSKLKHLQLLSYFAVGKHEENGIKELGELSNLHGSLWIRKLESVTSSVEAGEARLMDKTHIKNLFLQWSWGGDMATTSTYTEREILDKLQPHKGLGFLKIKSYRGTRFPDWLGHSSYHNMTCISLESCRNCCVLPSLGQLPFLKSLEIADFSGVETIGAEFYKNDSDQSSSGVPFPSLKYLFFNRMSCWEVWHSFESHAFPQLNYLKINDCPSLRGDLPNHLPTLKKLEVCGCPRLTGDLPNSLPALENLVIVRCQGLVSSLPRASSILELSICESNKLRLQELPISLQSLSIEGCELVESMFVATTITNHLICLQSLNILGCSTAISFPGDCLPECLKKLEIWYCGKLEFPRQQQHQHKLLESLEIHDSCDSLTSFSLDTFPNLKILQIENCTSLESLLTSPSQVSSLEDVTIDGCPNLLWFPKEGLAAPNLTWFRLYNCHNLKSLPCNMNTLLPKLKFLSIWDCPKIDSFPDGGLPLDTNELSIKNYEKLLSGLSSTSMLQGITYLSIGGASCESVKSFPKEGLMLQFSSLTTLHLWELSSLETLNCKELLHLTSLQELTIRKCPKLENMVGERLPSSLIKLDISQSPLLEERCNIKHPQIWPKISHIPGINVYRRYIS